MAGAGQRAPPLPGAAATGLAIRAVATGLAILVTAALPCPAQRVLLQNESGTAKLEYDCRQPRSLLPDRAALALIQDYTLRLATTLSRSPGNRAVVRHMNDLYVANDWPALERLSVREACAGRVPVLAFPSPGAPAPEFGLPMVSRPGSLTLRSLRGRIVVLDFWGTWCGICLKQMPEYVKLANDYPTRVAVLGVVMRVRAEMAGEAPDPAGSARAWLATHPPGRMIHVYDAAGETERDYQMGGAGYSFVVDTLGRVMRSRANPRLRMEVDELRDYLTRLYPRTP